MVAWELMIFHALLKGWTRKCAKAHRLKVCVIHATQSCYSYILSLYFFIVIIWILFYHDLSLDGMENEHRKIPIELRLLMNF